MRNFEVRSIPGKEVAGEWLELHPERPIKGATFCEFDLGEEVIGLIEYYDGGCEIGIGEALRPYDKIGETDDPRAAEDTFWSEVTKHVRSAYGGPRGE